MTVINIDVKSVQPAENVPRGFALPVTYDFREVKTKRNEAIPHTHPQQWTLRSVKTITVKDVQFLGNSSLLK